MANANAPISLGQRAPAEFIPTRTWKFHLRIWPYYWEHTDVLEQKNQCIRSLTASRLSKGEIDYKDAASEGLAFLEGGAAFSQSTETRGYPYPPLFKELVHNEWVLEQRRRQRRKQGIVQDENVAETFKGKPNDLNFSTRWIGIQRITAVDKDAVVRPVYVVLGIFPRGGSNPREQVVFVPEPQQLFQKLHRAAFSLQGWENVLFSLKHVKKLRLYKCNHNDGTHERIHLDINGTADMQDLLHAYKSWNVPTITALSWANWIHDTLNNESCDILNGTYSIELVLGWSAIRISIVVIVPVLLSLAIGLWLNSSAWTDLATIQTAWGTASYIVTAGGLLAALLGIISSISDG